MPNRKDFETFFDEADCDHSGTLTPKELYNVLKKFGYKLAKDDLKRLFRSIDVSGDKLISRQEFVDAMVDIFSSEKHRKEEIKRVFLQLDKNGDGHLNMKELQEGLTAMGINATQTQIEGMMTRCDTNRSGTIDLAEFSEVIFGIKMDPLPPT